MAILKIARMGHPVLSQPADPVPDPTAPEVRRLVGDMIETMEDAGGTGLAAPQVHVPLRVVVFYVSAARAGREDVTARLEDAAADSGVPLTVLINPEVEAFGEETSLGWEACLSLPELAGEVPRFTRIRYGGFDLDGNRVRREAAGFHARVVQHECDHLDGLLYPRRMTDLSRLVFASEMKHLAGAEGDARADDGPPDEVVEV